MEDEHSELGKRIIASLQEAIRHARGEDTGARVRTVEVTARRKPRLEQPPYYPPYLIREVRQKFSVSQTIFAQMLGVSASTVRAWEQGRREAEGPAARLLQIADRHPEVLVDVCGPIPPGTKDEGKPPRTLKAPAQDQHRLAAENEQD